MQKADKFLNVPSLSEDENLDNLIGSKIDTRDIQLSTTLPNILWYQNELSPIGRISAENGFFIGRNEINGKFSINKITDITTKMKRNIDVFNNNKTDDYPRTRRKRKYITICTTNCKYDVIRRIAIQYGMKEVTQDSSWNLYWTDFSISTERAKEIKRFQKINHFPGMTEICRKDLLAKNLNRMQRLFPKDYNFFPKTWCLPTDYGELLTYAKMRRYKTFIIKPDTGCQGRGIYLTKTLKGIKPCDRMICQVYLAKPFLIDDFKFDLRLYVLITSCDPLRIYAYNEGLVRFATSRYREPTIHNISNVFMHLTNYSVNKHSRMFIVDEENGSKRKISTLNKLLINNGVDIDKLWHRIDEIIVKTVLTAYPVLKDSYQMCFPTHDLTYACFEILGFDILIDWRMKPFLLEVNHSPSFNTDTQIDRDVKEELLRDTFRMLNFHHCDKRKIMEEDRKRVQERLLQGMNSKDTTSEFVEIESSSYDPIGRAKSSDEYFQEQYQWEDEHIGNFRRIYPCADDDKYIALFKQGSNPMFQNTVASRARREAARSLREEVNIKLKEEEGKRLLGKWIDHKVSSESPNEFRRVNSISIPRDKNKISRQLKKLNAAVRMNDRMESKTRTINVPASFMPENINENEEKERIALMAEREYLIKSQGITEQIYMAMKKNGSLKPADMKKYCIIFDKMNDEYEYLQSASSSIEQKI